MASKVFVFKNAENWTGFTVIEHLIRKFIFVILSTCCAHQGVHYVFLVKVRANFQDFYIHLDNPFRPKWPKSSL